MDKKDGVNFGADDYEANFDSRAFLNTFHTTQLDDDGEIPESVSFFVKTLTNCLRGLSGKKYMDLGCGPVITRAIPASRNFEEIVMADVSRSNLNEVRKWLDKAADAFNWDAMLAYYAQEEDRKGSLTAQLVAERVRSRIKKLARCDILNDDLVDQCAGPFDVINSTLVLDAACKNNEDFHATLRKIHDALVPGGHFILGMTLGSSYYSFGNNLQTFHSLKLGHVEVLHALESCNFIIIKDFYLRLDWQDPNTCDCGGLITVLAQRK